jgi:hypothetical protein
MSTYEGEHTIFGLFVLYVEKFSLCRVPVAHGCDPRYSGRNQEDHSSKPTLTTSLKDCISKLPNTKKAGLTEVVQVVQHLLSK